MQAVPLPTCQSAPIRQNDYRKTCGTPAQELFLNKLGMPYSEKSLNNAYRQLWAAPQGCSALPFQVTPHMLRHTFATLELYHHSQRMPLAQALGWVRDRLGHASLQTTSIYLHCLDLMDDADLNSYQQQLDLMMQLEEN
nr:tyrosine-type recombinase/integrase [uncultured Pseudogulbenkiania sp.]